MIVLLCLGFAFIAVYEYIVLRQKKADPRTARMTYAVTFLVSVILLIGYNRQSLINPNRLITLVFGPLQDWITMKK